MSSPNKRRKNCLRSRRAKAKESREKAAKAKEERAGEVKEPKEDAQYAATCCIGRTNVRIIIITPKAKAKTNEEEIKGNAKARTISRAVEKVIRHISSTRVGMHRQPHGVLRISQSGTNDPIHGLPREEDRSSL